MTGEPKPHMLACSAIKLRGLDLIEQAVHLREQLYQGKDTHTFHVERAREAIAEVTVALDTIEKALKECAQ